MQRFKLTEELRNKLKQPLGTLIRGEEKDTMNALKHIIEDMSPNLIICVGDIVSRNASRSSVSVNVRIIDNKVMRKETERFEFDTRRTFYTKNPAGTIELMAWQAVKEAIKTGDSLVSVNGEEDLLALIAILEAPFNSIVIYGQPKEGIVVVEVNEKKKSEVESIIHSMVVE